MTKPDESTVFRRVGFDRWEYPRFVVTCRRHRQDAITAIERTCLDARAFLGKLVETEKGQFGSCVGPDCKKRGKYRLTFMVKATDRGKRFVEEAERDEPGTPLGPKPPAWYTVGCPSHA